MPEKKVRQILVYTDLTEYGSAAVKHAATISRIFNADLHILHVIDDNTKRLFRKSKNIDNKVVNELEKIKNSLQNNFNQNIITYFESGCNCEIINKYAENNNVMLITICIHPSNELQYLTAKNSLKIIRKSRIPFLIIQKETPDNLFKNIILPLNHLKETKELASWASYFGKLNNSLINVILPEKIDDYTKNNLLFVRKVAGQFNASLNEIISGKNQYSTWKTAIETGKNLPNSLILCMNSKKENIFDMIFGSKEIKTISNKFHIPVLSLNPRNDLFVPCI